MQNRLNCVGSAKMHAGHNLAYNYSNFILALEISAISGFWMLPAAMKITAANNSG